MVPPQEETDFSLGPIVQPKYQQMVDHWCYLVNDARAANGAECLNKTAQTFEYIASTIINSGFFTDNPMYYAATYEYVKQSIRELDETLVIPLDIQKLASIIRLRKAFSWFYTKIEELP